MLGHDKLLVIDHHPTLVKEYVVGSTGKPHAPHALAGASVSHNLSLIAFPPEPRIASSSDGRATYTYHSTYCKSFHV